jgi:hypothetical protein
VPSFGEAQARLKMKKVREAKGIGAAIKEAKEMIKR